MGNQSSSTATRKVYSKTTTTNPYAYSQTKNKGTVSGFQDGTALNSIYNFVNNNIDSLLSDYLNPNLNSTTNQAKLRAFNNTLNSSTKNNLENNIINPLSARNMLRSSQAGDLYRNLANQNTAAISNFANELLSGSQSESAKLLSTLLSYYMSGANYLSDLQNHSLKASSGNATTYTNSSGGSQDVFKDILPMVINAMASSV